MIKQGQIRCFDERYEYMYDLKPGSFLGEYHIMFGLYSNMYYQPVQQSKELYINLFKIDPEILMTEISKDKNSFLHLHNISL